MDENDSGFHRLELHGNVEQTKNVKGVQKRRSLKITETILTKWSYSSHIKIRMQKIIDNFDPLRA